MPVSRGLPSVARGRSFRQLDRGAEYPKSCYTRRYMKPEKEKGRHDGRP